MPIRKLLWPSVGFAFLLVLSWTVVLMPKPLRNAVSLGEVAAPAAQPAADTTLLPREEMASLAAPRPYWQDPSVDPEVLEKAFAPVRRNLPPEARPKAIALHPEPKVWRKIKRDTDADKY